MAADSSAPVRIAGIDPGLNITGYGVVEAGPKGPRILEAGVIRGRGGKTIEQRLSRIFEGVESLIQAFHPRALALEEIYSHYQRPRTAILMGHARGVICLAAGRRDVPVVHYAATHVKKILTGSGRASKVQMQSAVQREFSLPSPPSPPDVADALALALCYYYLGLRTTQAVATTGSVRTVL